MSIDNPNFTIPNLTDEVRQELEILDAYDDPCFLHCYSKAGASALETALKSAASESDLSPPSLMSLNESTHFALFYADTVDITVLADELVNGCSTANIPVKISFFRHNPIGKAEETFRWSLIQLKDLVEESNNDQSFAINDFQDRQRWPGIEKYQSIDREKETAERKSPLRKALGTIVSAVIGGGNRAGRIKANINPWLEIAQSELNFELEEAFIEIAPFIWHLPNGESLWRYVMNGANWEILDEKNILLDLDHVLILRHAKEHAPEFLDTIYGRWGSVGEQSEIQDKLDRILRRLSEELLESQDQRNQRQACYLRVLDIFFHIFDQRAFSEDIFQQLVSEEETRFLSAEDYRQRYVLDIETEEGQLSESQSQKLSEILDDFDMYFLVSNRTLDKIDVLRTESRTVYNCELWHCDEELHKYLLAAILLTRDAQEEIQDDFTQALTHLVDDNLVTATIESLSRYFNRHEETHALFSEWLIKDEISSDALIASIRANLQADNHETRGYKPSSIQQPVLEIYSTTSDFLPLLATCYWRSLVGNNQIASKVISLSLSLAPQATLNCFSSYYSNRSGRFEEQEYNDFVKTLETLGVSPEDLFAFKARKAKRYDIEMYQQILQEYASQTPDQRVVLDKGLKRLWPKTYQQFMVDVWRVDRYFSPDIFDEESIIFDEVLRNSFKSDEEIFASYLADDQVLFSGYESGLPSEYELNIKLTENTRLNREKFYAAVLRYKGDHLELLQGGAYTNEHDGHITLNAHKFVIVGDVVSNEEVFSALDEMPLTPIYESQVKQAVSDYIQGKIIFEEYQNQTERYIDSKNFDLNIEGYCKYIGQILPLILAEPDYMRKLRFIKIITANKNRGKRILEEIVYEQFLDELVRAQVISFEERYDLELDDINDSGKQRYEQTLKTIKEQLSTIV